MAYVFWALFLFWASVMTHIFFCRATTRSGLQAKAFIFIAFLFLGFYACGVGGMQQSGALPPQSLVGLPFKITAGVIFVLLIPVYLCFYVLTQLMSPSKKILLAIAQRGALSHADIVLCVQEEDFINTRLKDLVTSGCVRQDNGRYRLGPSGQRIAGILNVMQCVLGRDIGG